MKNYKSTKLGDEKHIRYKSLVILDDGVIQEVNSIDDNANQFDYFNGVKTVLLCQSSIKEVIKY